MIWAIVTVFAITIAATMFMFGRGTKKPNGSLAGGLIALAAAAAATVIDTEAIPYFLNSTDGKTGWYVIGGLLGIGAAATFGGGMLLIGHFFAGLVKADEPPKA